MERRAFLKSGAGSMASLMIVPFDLFRETRWEFVKKKTHTYPYTDVEIKYQADHYESLNKKYRLIVAHHHVPNRVEYNSRPDWWCVHVESTDPDNRYGVIWGMVSKRGFHNHFSLNVPVNVQDFPYPDATPVMLRRAQEEKGYAEEMTWGEDAWGRLMEIPGINHADGSYAPCYLYHRSLINGKIRGLYFRCV